MLIDQILVDLESKAKFVNIYMGMFWGEKVVEMRLIQENIDTGYAETC